jgi:predicted MFS family arabinose efflux permease
MLLSVPQNILRLSKKDSQKIIIYLTVFLIALHITPAVYVHSSFLEQFVGQEYVGYIFTASSLLAAILFTYIKVILQKVGNYRTFVLAATADLFALLVLASSVFVNETQYPIIFITAYMIGSAARVIMAFNMDIFLEHFSSDRDTGEIRGVYLTSINLAFVLGPLISGLLISDISNAGVVYAWGALFMAVVLYLTHKYLRGFKDNHYKRTKLVTTIKRIWEHKDLSKICVSNFILRFFYSWMIIYTPIFLSQIGFTLGEIGLIMSFALLPFMILELPLGKIADKYFGEKEILTLGFFIAGLSTMLITAFDEQIFWLWAGLLFMTRVGASMIEIMNETYLFKKISDADVDILSVYRSVRPITYVISPIIASVLLIFIEINQLFLFLGILVFTGVLFSTRLKDTL